MYTYLVPHYTVSKNEISAYAIFTIRTRNLGKSHKLSRLEQKNLQFTVSKILFKQGVDHKEYTEGPRITWILELGRNSITQNVCKCNFFKHSQLAQVPPFTHKMAKNCISRFPVSGNSIGWGSLINTEGPALRAFWDLEKTVLHEIRVSGTVVGPLLVQKSPTCTYISQKLW